ncbi:MAG TPA: ATP-dependent DNA helicase, partial [Candidatus Saccharimonadales bacterium]
MEALNKKQQAAVAITDGPVLVVAGAGTGKTRVVVERIARMIRDGIEPGHILALTFTEKAAAEMLDRVSADSLGSAIDVTIATFNGFGNELLQSYGSEWGLGNYRLLGETGKLVFLRQHLDAFGLDYFAPVSNPTGQLDNLAGFVSLLKQQLVQPDAYAAYAASLPSGDKAEQLEKTKHTELARFYQTYLQLCRDNQVVDYDDQIYLTIRLLEERPNIRRTLQERYQYVMVDEFQDTNPMQSALVDLLAGTHTNLMVVGDDDQSIYGWRGATLANILDFNKRYKGARSVTLIDNYRSTQAILDAAYRLIQHNNPERLEIINKLDKRLQAQTAEGSAPTAKHFYNLGAELAWVTDDITKRLKQGQDPSTIAVLARRSQTVQKVHETLELYDIPHAMAGLSSDMYEQPVIKQLIEVLKAVNDPLDDMALFHAFSGPLFNLSQSKLAELAAVARREHAGLATAITDSDEQLFTAALGTIAEWRKDSGELSVGDLAYKIITDSGWKQQLYERSEDDPVIARQVSALSQFFITLKEFERIADIASVQSYLFSLPALLAGGHDFEDASLDISDSLVNVLSVHRAKGLEWDTVYIVDCTEGSFPLQRRGSSLTVPDELKAVTSRADEHMAEERRLMYVAVTRARRELTLTYADRHGAGAPRRPSRFLEELLTALPDEAETDASETGLERFAPRTPVATVPLPSSMHADGTLVMSVSQIVCWLNCPQDFYYQFVLGMPVPDDPSRQYGTAIHAAIEQIHQGRRDGNPPSLEDLLEHVKSALPRRGYASAGSRDRAHAQALQTVPRLYERFMHDPLPLEVEQSFGVHIPNTILKMVGRIDAVYQLEKGVEIRDFKTSTSVTTPEKAKSRATASQQLTLYALAWQLMHAEMPALLSLDFVETGQIGSVRK